MLYSLNTTIPDQCTKTILVQKKIVHLILVYLRPGVSVSRPPLTVSRGQRVCCYQQSGPCQATWASRYTEM